MRNNEIFVKYLNIPTFVVKEIYDEKFLGFDYERLVTSYAIHKYADLDRRNERDEHYCGKVFVGKTLSGKYIELFTGKEIPSLKLKKYEEAYDLVYGGIEIGTRYYIKEGTELLPFFCLPVLGEKISKREIEDFLSDEDNRREYSEHINNIFELFEQFSQTQKKSKTLTPNSN